MAGFDPLTVGLEVVGKAIDKIFPDKDKAEQVKLEMFRMQQAGEFKVLDQQFQLVIEQIKVNAVEAANASPFVSGWRTAAGWVCVFGSMYMTLFRPIMSWIATMLAWGAIPPVVDTTVLFELLGGMLGLGVLRTYEKIQGVTK